MSGIYDITMLLCIALLAVVVTVFVLAVSLLGRAIEEAGNEQRKIKEQEAEELNRTIQGAETKLKEAKEHGELVELKKELNGYEKRKIEFQKALRGTAGRYKPLTAKGSVLFPGILFLISLVLAGGARYVATVPVAWAAHFLWSLSLLGLAFGCYMVYHSLEIIQSVAVTTEEAQHKRTTKALETALEQHEKASRPVLGLAFRKEKPPFSFKPDTEEVIKFLVFLQQGDVANNTEVLFFAPEGFDFPGMHTWRQDDIFTQFPEALTTKLKMESLRRKMNYWKELSIKTPTQPGKYKLLYQLHCDGFASEFEEFEIEVIGGEG